MIFSNPDLRKSITTYSRHCGHKRLNEWVKEWMSERVNKWVNSYWCKWRTIRLHFRLRKLAVERTLSSDRYGNVSSPSCISCPPKTTLYVLVYISRWTPSLRHATDKQQPVQTTSSNITTTHCQNCTDCVTVGLEFSNSEKVISAVLYFQQQCQQVTHYINWTLFRPPGMVVMFYSWCFFLFSGTLQRYISELSRPIAVKHSHMIGSVRT